LQVHQLVHQLHQDTRFQIIESVETLLRPWHVTERSVRPAHRMVAHSGFLTTAVRCQPKVVGTASHPAAPAAQEPAAEQEMEEEHDGCDG